MSPAAPPSIETIPAEPEASLVDASRVNALLQEIADLRLSAAAYLTVAAAAMDAGRPDIAADLIEAQQRDVRALRARAEELIGVKGGDVAATEETRRALASSELSSRPRREQPHEHSGVLVADRAATRASRASAGSPWSGAGALVAIIAAVLIVLTHPLAPATQRPSRSASLDAQTVQALDEHVRHSYDELTATAQPRATRDDVAEATQRLHADLHRLLAAAAQDPAAAKRLLQVLQAERALLAQQQPSALADYEPQAQQLIEQLRSIACPAVLAVLPPAPGSGGGGSGGGGAPANLGEPAGQYAPEAPSHAVEPQPAPAPVPAQPVDPAPAPVVPPVTNAGNPPADPGTGSGGSNGAANGGDQLPQPPEAPAPQVPAQAVP